jgi:hypothetical protein
MKKFTKKEFGFVYRRGLNFHLFKFENELQNASELKVNNDFTKSVLDKSYIFYKPISKISIK